MSKICAKCGGEMHMHYYESCPMCDKPADKNARILDFFKVAEYIAAHEGYSYDRADIDNWHRKVLAELDFPGNDCYIDWFAPFEDEEEFEPDKPIWQFHLGLVKYFDVKENDKILLSISW